MSLSTCPSAVAKALSTELEMPSMPATLLVRASLIESVAPSSVLPTPRMPSAVSWSDALTSAAEPSEVEARPEPLSRRLRVESTIEA